MSRLFQLLFGCQHRNESRVFTIIKPRRQYRVCLDCGKETDYDFDHLGELPVLFVGNAREEKLELERMLSR